MSLFSHWGFKLAGSRRSSKSHRPAGVSRRSFHLGVERLESRRMLAITTTFAAGVLTFTGDAANDSLVTALNGNTVTYIANGGPQTVQPGVTSVVYNGGGGTNTISVQDTAGNSTLTVNGNLVNYSNAATPVLPVNLVAGTVQSVQAFDNSTLGHDTINVQATAIPTTIGYLHGVGSDTYNVASDAPANAGLLSAITSPLTVNSGAGTNTLNVSDASGLAPDTVVVTSSTITGFAPATINYTQAVGGTLGLVLTGPNAVTGSSFTVTSTLGAGNPVTLNGGFSGGTAFNIGSTAAANNGQLNSITAAITVNGGLGFGNTLEVNDHGSIGAFNYDVTPTAVTTDTSTPRPFAGVSYSGISGLQIDATGQPNTFFVTPSVNTTYQLNAYGPTAFPPAAPLPVGSRDIISINLVGAIGTTLTPANRVPGNSYNGSYTFSNLQAVNFTDVEQFTNQPVPAGLLPIIAYGPDAGVNSQPLVKVVSAATGALISEFMAFEPTFMNGVSVAVGFFDGTGQPEIAVAPGRGHSPTVKVFDVFGDLLFQFQAYASNFVNGVNVAAGNVENLHLGTNEIDDLVTSPTYGVADVRVFHNQFLSAPANPMTLYREFNPFGTSFIGGASVAAADMNGDGKADVIVGSGAGMVPTIDVYNVATTTTTKTPIRVIHPFATTFRGGVNVSALAAGVGNPTPLIVASQGNSGTSQVQVYNGSTGALNTSYTAYTGQGSNTAVRTTLRVVGGVVQIFTAQASDGRSQTIREFNLTTHALIDFIIETDPIYGGILLG